MPQPPIFSTTQRLQRAYAKGIQAIVKRVLKPIMPEQSLEDWLQELTERSQRADVREASDLLASRMVKWAGVKNARTWREAAAKSQRSRELYALLQRELAGGLGVKVTNLIQQNAAYISSVSLDAAQMLVHEVRAAQQAGARAGTIAKMMRVRFPELLKSRVHLISRTEVSKASASLTEARAGELDLPCYRWRTSKDVRVRDSHRLMEGVIVFYTHPPSPEKLDGVKSTLGPYHAGQAPNDRCYQEPVLDFNYVSWPAKVYDWKADDIRQMTKPQFLAAFGLEKAA
jgi:uncharacterized protein with gpF-like domain